jgi:hypothetical protein
VAALRSGKGITIPAINENEHGRHEFEDALHARLARRAHQFFEQNGTGHGQDFAHWLRTEAKLISMISELWDS